MVEAVLDRLVMNTQRHTCRVCLKIESLVQFHFASYRIWRVKKGLPILLEAAATKEHSTERLHLQKYAHLLFTQRPQVEHKTG